MKKSLSILLALCMLVSILCGVPVYAEVYTHIHCPCGSHDCEGTGHNNTQLWTAWEATDSLPTTAGYYYLTGDVTINSTWEPADGTYLCLNGHVIQMTGSGSVIHVNEDVSLTITDCSSTTHKFSVDSTGLWTLDETNGTKTVTGGVITGGKDHDGGGIYNEGTLTIYGGNITGNKGYNGGGICNISTGTVKMSGGEISGNVANRGGGVENFGGSFSMSGGSITGNTATYGDGGGIYNTYSGGSSNPIRGTVTLTGGSITGNTASNNGGGVYCDANSTITVDEAANITGNTANNYGGGVYCDADSTITVGGAANITGNTEKNYGTQNNLFLCSGRTVNILSLGGLTGSIGVTTEVKPSASSPVFITTNQNKEDISGCFTSDNANYAVVNKAIDNGLLLATNQVQLSVDYAAKISSQYYATVQAAVTAAGSGATVQMLRNSTENVVIDSEDTITLDLNGYVLSGNSESNSCVIQNNGTLTITDSNTNEQTHKFSVDSTGLWTLAETNGTKTVTGGVITGGTTSANGGGIQNFGTLTMNGGNIAGNTATCGGGGIYSHFDSESPGTLSITGGTITGNTASWYGGGICQDQGTQCQ